MQQTSAEQSFPPDLHLSLPILDRLILSYPLVWKPVNIDQASPSRAGENGSGTVLPPLTANSGPSQSALSEVAQMLLSGIAQKKLTFVSRLNPGASKDDGKNRSKLNISRTELTVLKFKFK